MVVVVFESSDSLQLKLSDRLDCREMETIQTAVSTDPCEQGHWFRGMPSVSVRGVGVIALRGC